MIQQGWPPGYPPVSTPPATSAKASVIQAPKSSSSPRNDHHLLSAEVKRNAVSPLVTGGTNASGSSGAHHFGSNADAFTTLVNTAVQQKSLIVPTKPPSAEGFEKCLIDNITASQSSHSGNKQTARIVYPPSQEELSAHHQTSAKVKSEAEGTRRLKSEPTESDIKMAQFSGAPFHGLLPGQLMSPADGERFMIEQRKRIEQMAAAAAGNGPSSAADKLAAGDRFRSVEAMMANHNAATSANNSPSLKFAREPFSSEHFERELRQIDFSGRSNAIPENEQAQQESLKVRPSLSSQMHSPFGGIGSSGQPLINPMKPSAGVSLEQMDEASKLFSASFQKDSVHQRIDSSAGGHLTAANLIDAIITRQINTDSSGSSKGNAPPSSSSSALTAASSASSSVLTSSSGGSQSLGNFSVNRFRSGLEGGSGQPLGPPVTTSALKLPSRPSSTSSGHSSQSSVIKVDATSAEAEEKIKLAPIDFSKVLPPTSASVAAAAAAVAGSSVPAGSLRETIFNVISNNFVSSPSAMDSKKTTTTTTSSAHQAIMDGISTSSSSAANIDKLRKALQTGEGGKHPLFDANDHAGLSVKRHATESEVNSQLRQQVIHMTGSSLAPSASRSMDPVSPGNNESNTSSHSVSTGNASSSATVTAATHWPPVQKPISTASTSTPAATASVSNPSSPWTSMPSISLFGMGTSSANSPNVTLPSAASAVTSGSGAFANFFQNRIEEAMRVTDAPSSNTSRSRAGSPKSVTTTESALRDSKTPESQKTANLVRDTYPDSPSSPEMVIDENRAPSLSPDIKTASESSPQPQNSNSSTSAQFSRPTITMSFSETGKKPEPSSNDSSSRSSTPGMTSSGVIKKYASGGKIAFYKIKAFQFINQFFYRNRRQIEFNNKRRLQRDWLY